MTKEEIIADERYHTCGRCKWENIPFICHACKWGEDTRKDLWNLKEDAKEGMTVTKTYCDRCRKEVIRPVERRLYLSGLGREGGYDLCNSCYDELCNWFIEKDKHETMDREEDSE